MKLRILLQLKLLLYLDYFVTGYIHNPSTISTSGGYRSSVQQVPGRSPQSSDEGIVLDSRWEGSCCSSRVVENKSALAATSLTEGNPSRNSLLSGKEQVQKATEHSVVVKCGGYELTSADLRTLEPHNWLNDRVSLPILRSSAFVACFLSTVRHCTIISTPDLINMYAHTLSHPPHTCTHTHSQIINCYMQLLTATYGHRHKVHIMSTFFYTKLSRSGYPGVERWLRRVDMRRLRLLLVPVHVSMCYWALAAVNFRAKVCT